MKHTFDYKVQEKLVVLENSISENCPQIAKIPREYESLFFVTEGDLLCETSEGSAVIPYGKIGYIANGALPKCTPYQCSRTTYIAFNFNFGHMHQQTATQSLPFPILCPSGGSADYGLLFHDALHHFISDTSSSMMICRGILIQILGYLYNDWNTPQKKRQAILKLKPAVTYLQQNFQNPDIRIEYIGELCNMSGKNCRRLFMSVYGEKPHSFLQKLRINHAKTLLLHADESIGSIACRCGFSDIYSFSHCFKRHTGISPIKYRKKEEI